MQRIRIIYFGTPHFALIPLEALIHDPRFQVVCVVTQQEKPVGRSQVLQKSAVQLAAERYGIDSLTPATFRDNPEIARHLQGYNPDMFVVDAYGKILPKEILDIPRLGAINIHPSLLPRYRGATPVPFALLNGDHETGVTIMKMDEKMDEGDILKSISEPIAPEDDAETLLVRLNTLVAAQLGDLLCDYADGHVPLTPQDHSQASYSTLLTKEMGRVNWGKAVSAGNEQRSVPHSLESTSSSPSQGEGRERVGETAEQIINKIRAFTPWPGVSTTYAGKIMKILSAQLASGTEDLPMGTVIRPDLVTTSSGLLQLLQVIPEGKKEMSFADFIRGIPEEKIVLE